MWTVLQEHSEPRLLRSPVLLVALSTSDPQFRLLYSQARELGKFLLKKLNFRLLASLYSSAMPPEVKISNNGVGSLVSNNFYHYAGGKRDYILFAGHSSPNGEEYQHGEIVLSYAKKLGVKELISFGPRWTESALPPLEPPKILGFASDEEGTKRLNDAGVTILKNESAFFFANTIIPLAKFHEIRAYKLSVDHGEPSPHPKSTLAFLRILSKMVDLDVDETDLHAQSKQLAESIRRSEIEGLKAGQDENEKSSQNEDIYR